MFNWAAAISAIVAAGALGVNTWAVLQARRTREVQLFAQLFYDVRQQERQLLELKAETVGGVAGDRGRPKLEAWSTTFFQTLEYLAFLQNAKLIRNRPLAGYFDDSVLDWYERVFLTIASEEDRTNPERYRELKKLYDRLKTPRVSIG